MTRNISKIMETLHKNRDTIRSFGVRGLALFGSVSRGEQTDASDLDFLVDFETKSFDAYMDLKIFLEHLFECQVDLVPTDAIKPRLRSVILKEAIHAQGL